VGRGEVLGWCEGWCGVKGEEGGAWGGDGVRQGVAMRSHTRRQGSNVVGRCTSSCKRGGK